MWFYERLPELAEENPGSKLAKQVVKFKIFLHQFDKCSLHAQPKLKFQPMQVCRKKQGEKKHGVNREAKHHAA